MDSIDEDDATIPNTGHNIIGRIHGGALPQKRQGGLHEAYLTGQNKEP